MTDKEKFLEYINSSNEFYSKNNHEYNHIKEFVCYEYNFGITKDTRTSKSGKIFVTYCIYLVNHLYNETDFVLVQSFRELKNADNALKALTNFD